MLWQVFIYSIDWYGTILLADYKSKVKIEKNQPLLSQN